MNVVVLFQLFVMHASLSAMALGSIIYETGPETNWPGVFC